MCRLLFCFRRPVFRVGISCPHSYAAHPAFGEADILEIATGLRPTLNHHNPEIRYSRARRLIEINGLFRHGFMIFPAATAAIRLAVALFDGKDAPEHDEKSGLTYTEE